MIKALNMKFDEVKQDLSNQWKLTSHVQFIPWVKGYFIIKLCNEIDRKIVSYEGPWKLKTQQLKSPPMDSLVQSRI